MTVRRHSVVYPFCGMPLEDWTRLSAQVLQSVHQQMAGVNADLPAARATALQAPHAQDQHTQQAQQTPAPTGASAQAA